MGMGVVFRYTLRPPDAYAARDAARACSSAG